MIKINVPKLEYFAELKAGKTIDIGIQFAESHNFDFLTDDRLVVAFGEQEKIFDEFDVCIRRVVDVPRLHIKLIHKMTEQALQEELEKQQLKIFEETHAALDTALQTSDETSESV